MKAAAINVNSAGSLGEAMLDLSAAPTQAAEKPSRSISSGAKLRHTAAFARQMQVLVGTGIPLAQALHATERQSRHPAWRALVSRIATAVDEGRPLSSAMAESGAFDAVTLSLISAGETSGNMGQMLERLADLKRRQLKLRSTLVGAMAYPCMLITMGIGVLLTMLLFVLPRFTVLFKSLDSPLPITTKFLMHASDLLREYWWALLIVVAVIVGGIWYVIVSGVGRATVDRYYLRVPVIGALGRSLLSARLSRMLGTLLEAKVPLTEALELTRRGAGNEAFAGLIASAEDAVARGQPLSSILDNLDTITSNKELLVPSVQEAIRNGEASGRLGQPLVQIAEFLDEENDVALKALTTTMEPAILIVLGVIVGFIALSIFLPMFDMISAAQGGG